MVLVAQIWGKSCPASGTYRKTNFRRKHANVAPDLGYEKPLRGLKEAAAISKQGPFSFSPPQHVQLESNVVENDLRAQVRCLLTF